MTPEELAEVERQLEEGTVATLLVNPVLSVAGGILGGLVVSVLAWRAAWRPQRPPRAGGYVAPRSRPRPRV